MAWFWLSVSMSPIYFKDMVTWHVCYFILPAGSTLLTEDPVFNTVPHYKNTFTKKLF